MIKLYNSRTKQIEDFKPLTGNEVRLYTCGPTVYHDVHLGNHRSNIMADILRRTLLANKFDVVHVMNITDVGHLTDDGDQGQDKMEKGAARENMTAWDIAEKYTNNFLEDIGHLNILSVHTLCKATDHIKEQVAQVAALIANGHTYETTDGIYFDTSTITDYGDLIDLKKQSLEAGKRVDMGEKKQPHDFALWKFTRDGESRQMEWKAFGRKGFPGWHIECSAMSIKYLGEQFDIHTGGIDLSRVHHINEIAQAEAVTGKKPWVNFWIHGEFLLMGNDKMSKSDENFLTVRSLIEKGYDPLAYRYFLLQAHYRKQLSFSWEALDAAANGLKNLRKQITNIEDHTEENPHLVEEILDAVNHDLNTAEALGLLQKALKEKKINKRDIETIDKIFGLDLLTHTEATIDITPEIQELLDMRAEARDNKDWKRSDDLRDELANMGVVVKDTDAGQVVTKQT